MDYLTNDSLRSSVLGCWLGKNIGGTLGAPFEGRQSLQNVTFYVQPDLNGNPEPNDDLDLQLVWLTMAEYYGVYNLTPRLFGDYWINNVAGPWNEYAICRWNCMAGFYPPLSGAVNNDQWKWSNGAWIRSEIWACLFPGDPDQAIRFAYLDASCDHTGEGIYAEMFTAALESAAFVEKDLRKLIAIALAKIPDDSRLRDSIALVCECYDRGETWLDARNKVLKANEDLGWFQAPENVAFAVIGLLYGEGNFGKTICLATNCGDDTDCTAATAGAVMGILMGAENIPEAWTAPIGKGILTKAINHFGLPVKTPKNVDELTSRVLELGDLTRRTYPHPAPQDLMSREVAETIWHKSPFELQFDLGFATIGIDYQKPPLITPAESFPLRLWVRSPLSSMPEYRFVWHLPEGWHSEKTEVRCSGCQYCCSSIMTEITPPQEIHDVMTYLQLHVYENQRFFPHVLTIPFRKKDTVSYPRFAGTLDDRTRGRFDALSARIKAAIGK